MAAPEKGLVLSGARARLMIDGIPIGWATNVSVSESISYEEVRVLDNIQVQEHVPTSYAVGLSASRIRIVGKTLKSQGFFPKLGQNADEHLENILAFSLGKGLTIQIEDSQTGANIATYEQAKVTDHNFTVTAVGIVGQDMNFVAIRAKDESEVI